MDCSKHALGDAMTDDGAGRGRPVGRRCGRARCSSPATWLCGAPIWSTDRARTVPTTSAGFYINGYVRAEDCDRGEWAFRNGEPVPFGPKPALVHYEELHERPEPHYVDD